MAPEESNFDTLGVGEATHTVDGVPVIEHNVSQARKFYTTHGTDPFQLCIWVRLEQADDGSRWRRLSAKGYSVKFHETTMWNDASSCSAVSIKLSKARRVTGLAFQQVVQHVIRAMLSSSDSSDTGSIVQNALHEYKIEHQQSPSEGLQRNEIVGLYGELIFMKWLGELVGDYARALNWWQGHDAKKKDFINGPLWAVEVKSSLARKRDYIWINGLEQLETKGVERLFLCHLFFNSASAGSGTLSQLTDEIRLCLGATHQAHFDQYLLNARYDTTVGVDYDAVKFGSAIWTFFDPLVDGFPRVTTRAATGDLALIHDLKYELRYSEIERYKVDTQEVAEALR
jgi:hypothetical protein